MRLCWCGIGMFVRIRIVAVQVAEPLLVSCLVLSGGVCIVVGRGMQGDGCVWVFAVDRCGDCGSVLCCGRRGGGLDRKGSE